MKKETVMGFLLGVAVGGVGVGLVLRGGGELGPKAGVVERGEVRVAPRVVGAGEVLEAGVTEEVAGSEEVRRVGEERGVLEGTLKVGGKEFDMQAMMQKGMERKRLAEAGAKILGLREAVGLSAEQEEAIRAYLKEEGEAESAQMLKMVSRRPGETVAVGEVMMKGPREKREAYEAFVNGVLDEGQRGAFAAHLEREMGERIDAAATSELAVLQTKVSLTDGQKEAAYAVFAESAAEMEAGGMSSGDGVVYLGDRKKKRERLAEVLSEEQMEVYRQGEVMFSTDGGAVLLGTPSISIDLGTAEMVEFEADGGASEDGSR